MYIHRNLFWKRHHLAQKFLFSNNPLPHFTRDLLSRKPPLSLSREPLSRPLSASARLLWRRDEECRSHRHPRPTTLHNARHSKHCCQLKQTPSSHHAPLSTDLAAFLIHLVVQLLVLIILAITDRAPSEDNSTTAIKSFFFYRELTLSELIIKFTVFTNRALLFAFRQTL